MNHGPYLRLSRVLNGTNHTAANEKDVPRGGARFRISETPVSIPQNPFRMTDSGHLSGFGVSAGMLAKVL